MDNEFIVVRCINDKEMLVRRSAIDGLFKYMDETGIHFVIYYSMFGEPGYRDELLGAKDYVDIQKILTNGDGDET